MSDVSYELRAFLQGYPRLDAQLRNLGRSRIGMWLRRLSPSKLLLGASRSSGAYRELPRVPTVPRAVDGTVRVSLYGSGPDVSSRDAAPSSDRGTSTPLVHETTWVNGPDYDAMEDNDLRGFLDGGFVHDWNQPGQVHVRLGRGRRRARMGEWELFRIIQRWDGIWLPEGASVLDARLEVLVGVPEETELEVLLYEVHKDWNPGKGGQRRDNVSAPNVGEVWWNEVGRDARNWGLPGVGLASENHPDADTPTLALARALYKPGDRALVFESSALAAYVQRRVAQGEPLLLLLKLSDYLEDIPGTFLDLFSANHGDSRNTARRPRLSVRWKSEREVAHVERRVLLEHGREIVLSGLDRGCATSVAVSFEISSSDERGAPLPTLSVRSGAWDGKGWELIRHPRPIEEGPLAIRIQAQHDPLPIGESFTAELRDTWVRTGPAEEQHVRWVFDAPSGRRHVVRAEYIGDYRWRVEFSPEELGRWQYSWSQEFTKEPYTSALGYFDVVPADPLRVNEALKSLRERIGTSDLPSGEPRARGFGSTFFRLERAAMYCIASETKRGGPTGSTRACGELRRTLDRVRAAISGRGGTDGFSPREGGA